MIYCLFPSYIATLALKMAMLGAKRKSNALPEHGREKVQRLQDQDNHAIVDGMLMSKQHLIQCS